MTSTHAPTASLIRLASVVALIGLAIALVAAPAAAQPYPPDPEITITTPGATIIIEGRSWKPGVQVTIIFNNPSGQTFSATAIADENGEIETDVPIPDDTEPGTLAVAFKGTGADGNPREEQGTVQVVSPDDAAGVARSSGVAGDAGSSDSAGGSSDSVGGSSDLAGTAGNSDGGDSSGAATTASEQVALGETGLGRTSATVPTTSSQSPAILLAVALMGAGVVSLFGARRARARRAAQ